MLAMLAYKASYSSACLLKFDISMYNLPHWIFAGLQSCCLSTSRGTTKHTEKIAGFALKKINMHAGYQQHMDKSRYGH